MTLLIRNVQVLGAWKEFPENTDVFVSGDTISAIGNFPGKTADEVIDGQGAYLAPGFIDVHTESDHHLALLEHPAQDDFLRQGVTTIIGGHDGASLAPLLHGELESLEQWTHARRMNVNWKTVSEFFRTLARHPLGVNFGTLAGYDTLRRDVLGRDARKANSRATSAIHSLLLGAFADGALGTSFSLDTMETHGVSVKEFLALLHATRVHERVLSITASRAEDIYANLIPLAADIKKQKTKLLFGHVTCATPDALSLFFETAIARLGGYFTISPFTSHVRPILTLLPSWARAHHRESLLIELQDTWFREKVKKELLPVDPTTLTVHTAPHHDALAGMTLADFMKQYHIKKSDEALIQLIEHTKGIGTYATDEGNVLVVPRALAHPRSFISSHGASFSDVSPMRYAPTTHTTSTFTEFLSRVEKDSLMTVSEAVDKLTRRPAAFFGLARRGEIREGSFADLVLFSGSDIRAVVVNGRVAMKDGVRMEGGFGRPVVRT